VPTQVPLHPNPSTVGWWQRPQHQLITFSRTYLAGWSRMIRLKGLIKIWLIWVFWPRFIHSAAWLQPNCTFFSQMSGMRTTFPNENLFFSKWSEWGWLSSSKLNGNGLFSNKIGLSKWAQRWSTFSNEWKAVRLSQMSNELMTIRLSSAGC
jgi:hypothetical protein